jgi:phosphoribosylformylglycinamidine synthase subunit PurS
MRAQVIVRLKSGVLDPQGEAVMASLGSIGFEGVNKVRIAKLIEIDLDADNSDAAKERVSEMADQLLANPVIESFEVEVLP